MDNDLINKIWNCKTFFNFTWICSWRIGSLARLSASSSLAFSRSRWRFLFSASSWLIWLDLVSWRLLLLSSLDWMSSDSRVLCSKSCCNSSFSFFRESKFLFSFLFSVIFKPIWKKMKKFLVKLTFNNKIRLVSQ